MQEIDQYTQEDFDKVKELFKEEYKKPPFELEVRCEDLRELTFQKEARLPFSFSIFNEEILKNTYKISEDELKSYINYQNKKYKSEPFETCLMNDRYFEQIITFQNLNNILLPPQEIIFKQGNMKIEISPASIDFQNHHRFHPLSQTYNDPYYTNEDKTINKYKPITIKILHSGELKDIKEINNLIERCIFYFTYNTNITLELQDTLLLPYQYTLPDKDNEINQKIKLINSNQINQYNTTILQYFKQGILINNDPVYKFLSFYHVLEYFFVLVSDEKLYANLRSIINQPDFNTVDEKNLDKIIQQVKQHRNMTDETQMLKDVLEKYITDHVKDKLLDFIQNQYPFKDEKGKSWLLMNKNHDFETVFSSEKEKYQGIKTDNGHDVLGQCAIRIKTIRNALVHSSDRYERQERFIPNKHNKQLLEKEIPLIKFLAEQIIIASAE